MTRISAHAIAVVALIVALGGTSYAAATLTGASVKDGTLTTKDIKDRSLVARDFRAGQLPAGKAGAAGARGTQGAAGSPGETGPQGAPGAPAGFTRAEADARFLPKGGKAADADRLDGTDGDDLVAGDGRLDFGFELRVPGANPFLVARIGDWAELHGICGNNSMGLSLQNLTDAPLTYQRTLAADDGGSVTVDAGSVAANATAAIALSTIEYAATLQILRGGGTLGAEADFATVTAAVVDAGANCRFHAEVLESERDTLTAQVNP